MYEAHQVIAYAYEQTAIMASSPSARITEPGWQSWELVRTKGPSRALDIIRQAERADADIAAYPRFKISDDASVVIGRFCGANKRH